MSLLSDLKAAAWKVLPVGSPVAELLRTPAGAVRYARHATAVGRTIRHFRGRKPHEVSSATELEGRRVLFAVHMPEWVDLATDTGIVLAAYGAQVRIAWLPHVWAWPIAQPFETVRERLADAAYRAAIPALPDGVPGVGGIPLWDVTPSPIDAATAQKLDTFAERDVMYLTKREAVDCTGVDRVLFEYRRARLHNAYSRLHALLGKTTFDSVVVPNGMVLEHRALVEACADRNVPTLTYDFWDPPGTCVVNFDRPLFDGFELTAWDSAPKRTTEAIRARVKANMTQREAGKIQTNLPYPSSRTTSAELRERLRLDDRPVVLLSPNVPYDSAFLGLPGAFKTLRDWLVGSLDYLCRRDDCVVIVRAHPAEGYLGAGETVADIIRSLAGGDLPPNLRFIPPDSGLSTYDLIPLIRVGVVYSSTVGLELGVRGVPAIVTTKIHYGSKGFTFDAHERNRYFELLNSAIAGHLTVTPEQVDRAWCYYDLFLNRLPLSFPFHPSRVDFGKWKARKAYLDEVLAASDHAVHGTYAVFAGGQRSRDTYRARFADP